MDADARQRRDDAGSDGDVVVDLTGGGPPFSVDQVVRWLRTSGGSLYERSMKCTAARMLEAGLDASAPAELPGSHAR
jgi:hypothetical protein